MTGFSTTGIDHWSYPELVMTNILEDSIEMIYKQSSLLSQGWSAPPSRVYKTVFSCVDGKWNKSDPIFGIINERIEEAYFFPEKEK